MSRQVTRRFCTFIFVALENMKWKNLNQAKWLEQYYKLKISILKFQLKKYSKALKKLKAKK